MPRPLWVQYWMFLQPFHESTKVLNTQMMTCAVVEAYYDLNYLSSFLVYRQIIWHLGSTKVSIPDKFTMHQLREVLMEEDLILFCKFGPYLMQNYDPWLWCFNQLEDKADFGFSIRAKQIRSYFDDSAYLSNKCSLVV